MQLHLIQSQKAQLTERNAAAGAVSTAALSADQLQPPPTSNGYYNASQAKPEGTDDVSNEPQAQPESVSSSTAKHVQQALLPVTSAAQAATAPAPAAVPASHKAQPATAEASQGTVSSHSKCLPHDIDSLLQLNLWSNSYSRSKSSSHKDAAGDTAAAVPYQEELWIQDLHVMRQEATNHL